MSSIGRHNAWLWVRRWSRRTFITVGIVVILLLLLRLALPSLLERAIDSRRAKVPDYAGSVERVDLSLLRGAYRLHQIRITKKNGAVQEPFFSARDIDFSVAWRQLFRGQIVSDIYIDGAEMNI